MQKLFLALLLLSLSGCASLKNSSQSPNTHELASAGSMANAPMLYSKAKIEDFARAVASANQIPIQKVMAILAQAIVQPDVINAMNRPYEHLAWSRYQDLYVRPSVINGGVEFWQKNQSALKAAAQQYGVPVQVIMAILGVETVYGKNIGHYRALDTLYTLAFDYPRRAAFFQKEFIAFLSLTLNSQLNPLVVKSSYAGALGMPQFMPSNYLKYAVSANGKFADLFVSKADASYSVANYLKQMGWQKDQPVAIQAKLTHSAKLTDSLKNDTFTLDAFKKQGIHAEEKLPGSLRAKLIMVKGKKGAEYWFTFKNFYVIKKYNSSNLYALAVYQVAETLSCKIPDAPNNGVNCTSASIP